MISINKGMPRTVKLANLALMAIVLIVALGLFNVLMWSYQSEDVLKFNREPLPVLTKTVKKTDGVILVRVEIDFCKLQGTHSIENGVRPKLVSDKTEINLKSYTDSLDKKCDKLDAPMLLPPQAVPDTYHIEWEVEYKLNPIKETTEKFRSEDFQIVADTPPGVQGPQGVQGIQGIPGPGTNQ